MTATPTFFRALILGTVIAVGVAGCQPKTQNPAQLGNQVAPGSQRDSQVNVGDRIYFQEDQSTLTPEAQEWI